MIPFDMGLSEVLYVAFVPGREISYEIAGYRGV